MQYEKWLWGMLLLKWRTLSRLMGEKQYAWPWVL